VFPASCPTPTIAQWVQAHAQDYDFNRYGWPAWYPTRTLEEWEKARALWEPYVFRTSDSKMRRPVISYTSKKKRAGKMGKGKKAR